MIQITYYQLGAPLLLGVLVNTKYGIISVGLLLVSVSVQYK